VLSIRWAALQLTCVKLVAKKGVCELHPSSLLKIVVLCMWMLVDMANKYIS
jgi:hypothetical protein